jgi:hypothetical protein
MVAQDAAACAGEAPFLEERREEPNHWSIIILTPTEDRFYLYRGHLPVADSK